MSKMKNKFKRVISLCLVLMLVVTFVQVSVPVKADAADTAEAVDMTDITVDAATDATDTADTVDTTDTTEAVDKVDKADITEVTDEADTADAVNATDTTDTTDKANTADVADTISDVAVTADTSNYYTLDLNSEVDDECLTHLPDGCTCDLYINGQLEAAGINDIFKQYPYGTTYEFKNFKTGVNLVYANKVQSVYHDSEGNLDKNCQPLKGTVKAYLNSSKYGGMTHVVPIFNTKSVNVTFHRNTSSSDTETTSQKVTYGVANQKFNANTFKRDGYKFVGWAFNKNATKIDYPDSCNVVDSWIDLHYPKVDLYAVWTANTYSNLIGHWAEGFKYSEGNNDDKTDFGLKDTYFSASYKSNIVMDSAKAVKIPNGYYLRGLGTPEVDGIFKGYSIGLKLVQKPKSMWFEYYYAPTVYSVTYNLNGGINNNANPSTYTVLYGVTLKNPTRTGYTFTGWYDEKGNKVTGINEGCNAMFSSSDDLYAKLAKRTTGNKTLTACWEPIHYTVTYDANGGTGTMSTDTVTYDENYVTKANQFTRTGYEFIGWTTNADGSGSNWTSWIGKPWKWTYTKNITLYAQWKAKTYTITYEPNGGVGDRYTQTATYDAYFKTMKNRFTRTGYTFAGFIDLNGRIGTYAKINKKSFLENNALKHPWQLCKVDSEYQFYNYTDKVWETYCLIYWEGPYNVDYGCSPSNFTLSAKWWANNYTVKLDYKKDVSSSYEKTIVTTYDKAYGELPQPVVQGWTFKGWNTKSDGTGTTVTADTVYKIAGDSTLYAQWQINTYDLSVKHTVSGNMGNKCSDFSFTLNLSGMSGNNITAVFTDASGKQTTKILAMNNGKVAFTLKHGETVVFKNVPYNTSYTITEDNVRDYIVSSSNASGKVTDNTAVTFTSVRNIMVPTSADTNIIAMISIVCVAGVAILLILKKRRKTK